MSKDLKQGSGMKLEISPADGKPKLPAVLKLTVKKEWFDLIKSGEKTEEYREVKKYWYKRLVFSGITRHEKDNPEREWEFIQAYKYKHFEYVEFKNGYSKDAPTIIAKLKGIRIGNPTQGGKHLFKDDVFIISIGDIVWSNCV